MEKYDHDDPPPKAVTTSEYWHVFRLTFPTQLFWLAVYGLIVLLGYLIVGVRLSQATPVCAEKSAAYKLTLADIAGTGPQKWEELVAEGLCGDVPARYLFTLDTYTSDEFTRVVEWMIVGTNQRAYGLMTSLPSSDDLTAK